MGLDLTVNSSRVWDIDPDAKALQIMKSKFKYSGIKCSLRALFSLGSLQVALSAHALGNPQIVSFNPAPGAFPLSNAATLYVGSDDWAGVKRVADDLSNDLEKVTSHRPQIVHDPRLLQGSAIVLGTIGKSALVDALIKNHKLDVTGVTGKWESYVIQTVQNPIPGVKTCLVIAGSDKRGSIFGAYEVSEQVGVSPWYWWADVPVIHHASVFVKEGRVVQTEPAVRYRGIFLNDEAPDLSNWVIEKFGNYNHKFYAHVFELLLRLKANYLWPAMWNNCFNQDDPENQKLADEYGIVMGTSHVEPMMRADKEWNRAGFGANEWRFDTHAKELLSFWADGLDRSKPYEDIVTIAMRGKIDTPMSETANIDLLETIVAAQRKLIAQHLNPDVTKVPQLWALYKEVQEYYEKGMRVPDDVTLLWCDDNWGDIRRLPTTEERSRSGGAGVYYHFDYVGGPRNYKWTNTNPLPKIWEQMNNAYDAGANRIWIVNVGCLKPKEFPIEFFLDLAWNPKKWPKEKLGDFAVQWATREFGPSYSVPIADVLKKYAKYNGRRKPELVDPETYSIVNYDEADRVMSEFKAINSEASTLMSKLSPEYRDAFYQLVLFPTESATVLNEMYIMVAKNRLYAKQGRVSANMYAERAKQLYQKDADLSSYFNHQFANGRWSHFQDQTHIGYTSWQQPDTNVMPKVEKVVPTDKVSMGVAIEGSQETWPGSLQAAVLPTFDKFGSQKHTFEVFDRGIEAGDVKVTTSAPWIQVWDGRDESNRDHRYTVTIDWLNAPRIDPVGRIEVGCSDGKTVSILVKADSPARYIGKGHPAFREVDGYIAIEAEHFKNSIPAGNLKWETIPDYGRTLSGVTVGPITVPSAELAKGPHLEYPLYLQSTGDFKLHGIFGPSLSTMPGRGLRYAISLDNDAPQIVDIDPKYLSRSWETAVSDSVRDVSTKLSVTQPGMHTLKVWMIDPGVVLEKLVLDFGGLRPSYLGPPESPRN